METKGEAEASRGILQMNLHANTNLEEYVNPEQYDVENKGAAEMPMLLKWLGQSARRVVELACGTGRVTIPMAEEGFEMTGVDITDSMLALARDKAQAKSVEAQWILANMLEWNPEELVDAVYMAGNSFQHLLTNAEQETFVKNVHHMLKENGLLIFDLRNATSEELATSDGTELSHCISMPNGETVEYFYNSTYDPISQIQHNVTYRFFKNGDRLLRTEQAVIDLRYTYPQELRRLLEYNGFDIEHVYGNWRGDELNGSSVQIVAICRRRK
ncbi:class I SAM-dependent DNA methyltransferase [Paenibacillus marinisediminis]